MFNSKWFVILLFLVLLGIGLFGLTSCNTVCPDQTKVEVGVTETDAKNDKFQEKRFITQTWKWGKKKCAEKQ